MSRPYFRLQIAPDVSRKYTFTFTLSHLKNAHKSAFLLCYRLFFRLSARPFCVIQLPLHNIYASKPPNRYNHFCLKTQQKSKLQFWAD